MSDELEADFTFLGPESRIRFECHAFEYVEVLPPEEDGDFRLKWKAKPTGDDQGIFRTEGCTWEQESDRKLLGGSWSQ